MKNAIRSLLVMVALTLCMTLSANAQPLDAAARAKVEKQIQSLKALAAAPEVISAVKAFNTNPPAAYKGMTNENWKGLTLLDPLVRNLAKNGVAQFLKTRKMDLITEAFVSGADGGKVGFLSKTTSWNHRGKAKHDTPMSGQVWIGPVEVDESSGQRQVQVALPVMEGGKPIGSLVIGLSFSKL